MSTKRIFYIDVDNEHDDLPESRTTVSDGRKRLITDNAEPKTDDSGLLVLIAAASAASASDSLCGSPSGSPVKRGAQMTRHYYLRPDVLYTFECALRAGDLQLAFNSANELINTDNPCKYLWINMFDFCVREVGCGNFTVLPRLCQMHRLHLESQSVLGYTRDAITMLCQTKKSTTALDALILSTNPSSAPDMLNFRADTATNSSSNNNIPMEDDAMPFSLNESTFVSSSYYHLPESPLPHAKTLFHMLFKALHEDNLLLAIEAACGIYFLETELRIQLDNLPGDVRKSRLYTWIRNSLGKSTEDLYRSAQQVRTRPTLACFVLLGQWTSRECGVPTVRNTVISRLKEVVAGPFAKHIGDQLLLLVDSILVSMTLVRNNISIDTLSLSVPLTTAVPLLYIHSSPASNDQEIAQRRTFSVYRRLRAGNTLNLLPSSLKANWSREEIAKSHGDAFMPSFEEYWNDLDLVPIEQCLPSPLHAIAKSVYINSAHRDHRSRAPFSFGVCIRNEMAPRWFNSSSSNSTSQDSSSVTVVQTSGESDSA